MPKPYPQEFRDDLVAVARRGEAPLKQVASDFGISTGCLGQLDACCRGRRGDGVPFTADSGRGSSRKLFTAGLFSCGPTIVCPSAPHQHEKHLKCCLATCGFLGEYGYRCR